MALAVGALATALPVSARAQLGDIPRSVGQTPAPNTGIEVSQKLPYWGASHSRLFVSSIFDAGIINLTDTLAVGYGRPHWRWIGLEGSTTVATQGGLEYLGIHAALPFLELRVGGRYDFDLNQYFLPPQTRYFHDDISRELGPKQRYIALQSELSGSVPLPYSSIFAVATVGYLVNVPANYYVFEDTLHTVLGPPWYVRGRLGYFFRFGLDDGLKLGGAVESIFNPGRDTITLRTGPIFAVTLSHHLDASASFMLVAASNDKLGLLGGEFTTIGLHYRWATGDRWPEFP